MVLNVNYSGRNRPGSTSPGVAHISLIMLFHLLSLMNMIIRQCYIQNLIRILKHPDVLRHFHVMKVSF